MNGGGWRQARLGDHVEIQTGFPFKSKDYTEDPSGIALLRGDNIVQGNLRWEGVKRWPNSGSTNYNKYLLCEDDVVVAMDRPWIEAGLKYAWITKRNLPCLLVQRVSRLRGINGLSTGYVRYIIGHHSFTDYVKGIWTGVAVPHISESQIRAFHFQLPPAHVQARIVAILRAYDDLIENNTRRIKILEQMAQMLYREWFVNFRFPGHDKVKLAKSEVGEIPIGWELKRMDEVVEVIDCLHSKKPEHIADGSGLLLQLFNIGENGKLDISKRFLVSDSVYKLWTSRIEVRGGDCVITNVGRIAAVAQIPAGLRAALGRNMTGIRPRGITPTYLIEYLLSPYMAAEVSKKKDAGAIMDSLNVKGIVRLTVPMPPPELMQDFEQLSRPLRRQVEVLVQKNLNLRSTLDLLLPKLVSGEVSVEQIEQEVVAEMV
jgi:type I restriction enzyme S subunit